MAVKKVVVLGDCDSFYVSVERFFNRKLSYAPTVVLTNGNKCVASACPESKKIGAKTGVPLFEIKERLKFVKGNVCRANYVLYGDFSSRFIQIVKKYFPKFENYSVDELFFVVEIDTELFDIFHILVQLSEEIFSTLGIRMTFGASYSKILAKRACKLGKKSQPRVYTLLNSREIKAALMKTNIEDVWGIGKGWTKKLKAIGVHTAWQLTEKDNETIRRIMTIKGRRTQDELRGIPSFEMMYESEPKQEITSTRTFLEPKTELDDLVKEISDRAFKASSKLRRSKQVAHRIQVFIETSRYKPNYIFFSREVEFEQGESAPNVVVNKAIEVLKALYEEGGIYEEKLNKELGFEKDDIEYIKMKYAKGGVELNDLRPKSEQQLSIFSKDNDKNDAIATVIDKAAERWGYGTIRMMTCSGVEKLPEEFVQSKEYTTDFKEILEIDLSKVC